MIITERMRSVSNYPAGSDLDDFLHDLQIQCVGLQIQSNRLLRIAQMTQKTNPFNMTTRRYQIPDIQRFRERRSAL